jgi:hypothetical protein
MGGFPISCEVGLGCRKPETDRCVSIYKDTGGLVVY